MRVGTGPVDELLGARIGRRGPLICVVAGLLAGVVLALLSDGSYHDDALTHYLYARWAWDDPAHAVDEWGRPGLTALLMPAAPLGWTACRIEIALLSAAAVWLAYDTARRLGWPRAGWVPLLCYAQPLFVLASYTTLTESALAVYLMLAMWLLVRERPACSAAALSLCFVTRYESLVLAPLWVLAAWRYRRWWWTVIALAWAPLLHNLLGVLWLGRWPLAFILGASHPDHYGAGTPLSMVVKSMATSGPAVAILAVVGLGAWPRPRRAWIIPAVYGVYLLTQTVLYWQGLFATGGYARFLVGTAPVAALCALAGANLLDGREPGGARRGAAALAAVAGIMLLGVELEARITDEAWLFLLRPVQRLVRGLALLAILLGGWLFVQPGRAPRALLLALALAASALPLAYLVRPHRLPQHTRDLRDAITWLRAGEHADAPVIATNIWVSHFLERGRNVLPPESTRILDRVAPGTVFVWDAEYSTSPRFAIQADALEQDEHWQPLFSSPARNGAGPFVRLYLRR